MLKRSVRKRAGFSVNAVAPLDCVGASFIPALFGELTHLSSSDSLQFWVVVSGLGFSPSSPP